MRFILPVAILGAAVGASMMVCIDAAEAAKPQCQTMAVQTPNGGTRDALMCKDDKGRWYEATPQASFPAPSVASLPAKARVTYQGQYAITVTKPTKQKRNPSILDLVKGGEKKQQQGMVTFDLNFDGPSVSGSMKATGGGQNMGISGMVQNGICTLYTANGDETYEGRCDAQGFNADIASTGKKKEVIKGTLQTSTLSLVDVSAEQAKQAQTVVNANAEKEAEKQRMEDLLNSLPPAKGN